MFGNDSISYIFSCLSQIRSLTHHKFIHHYTQSKMIHSNTMILSKHNFRSYTYLKLHALPIYPGVPLVSYEFSGLIILAIPKSVSLGYPYLSNTIFSGFMSLCIIPLWCKYSKAKRILPMTNPNYSLLYYLYVIHWIFSIYLYESEDLLQKVSPLLNINDLDLKKHNEYLL